MKCQREVKRNFSLTNNNQQRNQNQKVSDELKMTIAKKSKFPDRIKKKLHGEPNCLKTERNL